MSKNKSSLRNYYRYKQFFPSGLGILINPFYFDRKGLAKHITELSGYISGRILDVGCGSKPYAHLFSSEEYIGLEIDTPQNRALKNADHFYDGSVFPYGDATFDSVVSSEVFEHVFNPDQFMSELYRVLKPGGTTLLTMPFVWDEHEQPHDFARYTSFGIRALMEKHGFVILEQRKSTDDIRVIFQLLNVYIYKKTATHNTWLNAIITLLFMAPINLLGELLFLITPRNQDLYLNNIVLAKKNTQA